MSNFNDLIQSSTPVLVDFYADWCGPCKTMFPVLEQLSKEVKGKAKVIKVNVDKNMNAALKYQVRGVPTFILFKNGQVKWKQSGVLSLDQLKQAIHSHA